MRILIICGTNRPNSGSQRAASWVEAFVRARGHDVTFIDFHQFPLPWLEREAADPNERATADQNQVKVWSEQVERAEAVIIIAPEYNHGYPGVLKNALDLIYAELNYKPVLVCGVSSGSLGGVRMVEQLRLVLIDLRAVPIREAVYFRNVGELFAENGKPQNVAYERALQKGLDELALLATPLTTVRAARKNLP